MCLSHPYHQPIGPCKIHFRCGPRDAGGTGAYTLRCGDFRRGSWYEMSEERLVARNGHAGPSTWVGLHRGIPAGDRGPTQRTACHNSLGFFPRARIKTPGGQRVRVGFPVGEETRKGTLVIIDEDFTAQRLCGIRTGTTIPW